MPIVEEVGVREWQMIRAIWEANNAYLPDEMRGDEIPYALLFGDDGLTKWYAVPEGEAVLVVGDLRPELSASMLVLNHTTSAPWAIHKEVLNIINEFALQRIQSNVTAPQRRDVPDAPTKGLKDMLKYIGFRQEGHLRRAARYNGFIANVDILALYREPSMKRDYVKAKEEIYATA